MLLHCKDQGYNVVYALPDHPEYSISRAELQEKQRKNIINCRFNQFLRVSQRQHKSSALWKRKPPIRTFGLSSRAHPVRTAGDLNPTRVIDLCNKLYVNSWACHKTVQSQRLSVEVRNRCNLASVNSTRMMLGYAMCFNTRQSIIK